MTDRYSNKILKLTETIKLSKRIVFFGGAGVSTESGIPDFRSSTGIYSGNLKTPQSPEVMLSHNYFMSNTAEFFDFYKNQMLFPNAKPNNAHIALKELENQGKLIAVITQNIDGLHYAAGSKTVYELHGSCMRNTCMSCNESYGLDFIQQSKGIPRCSKCDGIIKPDVVLYGEGLNQDVIEGSIDAIQKADTLIVGGTSLEVNPASSLIEYFSGERFVIINKSPTKYDSVATLVIREPIGEVLKTALNP